MESTYEPPAPLTALEQELVRELDHIRSVAYNCELNCAASTVLACVRLAEDAIGNAEQTAHHRRLTRIVNLKPSLGELIAEVNRGSVRGRAIGSPTCVDMTAARLAEQTVANLQEQPRSRAADALVSTLKTIEGAITR